MTTNQPTPPKILLIDELTRFSNFREYGETTYVALNCRKGKFCNDDRLIRYAYENDKLLYCGRGLFYNKAILDWLKPIVIESSYWRNRNYSSKGKICPETLVERFEEDLLDPKKEPSLDRLHEIDGKLLGCWCWSANKHWCHCERMIHYRNLQKQGLI